MSNESSDGKLVLLFKTFLLLDLVVMGPLVVFL